MSDVFLSYASEDRGRLVPLVRALERDGVTVWWDREIQVGTAYDREIEAAMAAASCVVVAWSSASIESEYVRSEVEEAVKRSVLIPVMLDEVTPPLAYRRLQAADLTRWSGGVDREYQKLLTAVRSMAGSGSNAMGATPRRRTRLTSVVLTLLALLAFSGAGYAFREELLVALVLNFPSLLIADPIEQNISFAQTADGVRIAYATSGSGPPVLHVLSINTDLERGQNSPIYDNDGLLAMSSKDHYFVRYDGRGVGLSDRDVTDYSLEARVADIEAVVDAAGLDRFSILAISAGGPAAITYTARHPERVSRLVLAGTFLNMNHLSGEARNQFEQMLDLFEVGWQTPAVSNMWAEMLLGEEGDPVSKKILGALGRRAMSGETIAAFERETLQLDVSEYATAIRVPTIVMHSPDDTIVPIRAARELASLIPGARLELVRGGHMASSASTPATRKRALALLNDDEGAP